MKDPKEIRPSRRSRTDGPMNSQRLAACTGLFKSKSDRAPVLRVEVYICKFSSLFLKPSSIGICLQRKITFLQQSLTQYTNHTSGQASCPAVDDQHKSNSVVFGGFICLFVLFCFNVWLGIFSLPCGYLHIHYGFWFYLCGISLCVNVCLCVFLMIFL